MVGALREEAGGVGLEVIEVRRPAHEVGASADADDVEAILRARPRRPLSCSRGGQLPRSGASTTSKRSATVEPGARQRRVQADQLVHLADLPVAREGQVGARAGERAEAPSSAPTLLAHVVHAGAADEVGGAMPGLHRGPSHPQRGEVRQVVGLQALDVNYAVAAVAGGVGAGGLLDRIEGDADAAVSRRMGVGLEAEPVDLGDYAGEFAEARGRAVGVVVEHPDGVRLDHVVGVELDRAEAQALVDGGGVDGLAQIRAEGGIRIHRMEEGGDDATRELAIGAGAEQQVYLGERRLRLDDGGDAGGAGHAQAGEQLARATLRLSWAAHPIAQVEHPVALNHVGVFQ